MTRGETALGLSIRRYIEQSGPISLATFMALALGHPKHGYYTTQDPIGARGDFITAPEISQLFGECVAAWCALAWEALGKPAPFHLVELGPGRGTLMSDILRTAEKAAPEFFKAARVHLVELSPALKDRQQAALAGWPIAWHGAVTDVPPGPMVAVANEFFDSLPILQFVRVGDAWRERCVDWDRAAARFVFRAEKPLPGAVPVAVAHAPEGTIFEVGAVGGALAESMALRLAEDGGAALVIDYGHERTKAGDTLVAIRAHKVEADPLQGPGGANLSAHVNFEALGQAFARHGLACHGPIGQGAFLTAMGIGARRDRLMPRATPDQALALKTGCERLVDPEGMGVLFKALAVAGRGMGSMPGFPVKP